MINNFYLLCKKDAFLAYYFHYTLLLISIDRYKMWVTKTVDHRKMVMVLLMVLMVLPMESERLAWLLRE